MPSWWFVNMMKLLKQYLKLNNKTEALNRLRDAYQIANALNDTETMEHLEQLINDLQDSIVVDSVPVE